MIKTLLLINAAIIPIFNALLASLPVPVPASIPMVNAAPTASSITLPEESRFGTNSGSVISADGFQAAALQAATLQAAALQADTTPPVIDVWYGNNQSFTLGTAQNWLNILGNAHDPESGVTALMYSLNGSSYRTLSLGPDGRRLVRTGDFNIDIAVTDSALIDGSNTVTIRAVNGKGLASQSTMQFNYAAGQAWSLPYSVTWNAAPNIQQVVQIVDGKWQVTPGGVRTTETGYDRVLAIGDITWKDFEILVPITINAIDTSKYGDPIGVDPGIGVNLRWLGHTDDPIQCAQPKCGWNPTGASVWYEFFSNSSLNNFSLQAYAPYDTPSTAIQFTPGNTYWIRARVETNASGSLYKAKAWQDGSTEPSWMLTKQTDLNNLNHGSLLLVAHYVDATFGDIRITPVSNKISQSIVFDVIPDKTYGDADFQINASASSGLPVSFRADGACAVYGDQVSINGAGNCTITASQPGDAVYAPAPDFPVTFNIAKANARLSLIDHSYTYDGEPKLASVTVSPSNISGVSVLYDGSNLVPMDAGAYTITATLNNPNYQAAPATATLEIARASQAISVTAHAPETAYAGRSFTVAAATSAQSLDVVYTSGSPSTCINQGPVFTITGQVGQCVVRFEQQGNQNYSPAQPVTEMVNIESRVLLPGFNLP